MTSVPPGSGYPRSQLEPRSTWGPCSPPPAWERGEIREKQDLPTQKLIENEKYVEKKNCSWIRVGEKTWYCVSN